MRISAITQQDVRTIWDKLSDAEKERLQGASVLVTGFAGSLGYTLLHFFRAYGGELGIQKVYGIDSYQFGKPAWLAQFVDHPLFDLREADVTRCSFDFCAEADVIFHMASLASPVYYRLYPLETIDADVWGLRRLLEYYKQRPLRGFLFYSSSEIYGDPARDKIPTDERYWGNVNTVGPRACYDESKRMGETLCYTFAGLYQMPITVVRPFNNYGPGMRINDERVVADFAKAVMEDGDIVIFSDGTPTRTFDYIPDATAGYLKCALYGRFDVFNIGSHAPEINIANLAALYKRIGNRLFGYDRDILYKTHVDRHYLTDNPSRRCPDTSKAQALLGFTSTVSLEAGVERYLRFLHGE